MRLDKMIKEIDLCIDTWHDGFSDKDLNQLSKWLKELKKLRKQVKHCKAVHGAFFNELAEQGIIT